MDGVLPDAVFLFPSSNAPPILGSPYYNASGVQATGPSVSPPRDETLAAIEIGVQCTVLGLTVAGNTAVLTMILSMSRHKELGRMYTMIGHLSCADLFVATFNLLPQLAWDITHRFRGGRALCKAVKYLQVVAMYASSYVLVSTAVDRYSAICRPMTSHTWTDGTAHRLAAVAWVLSAVFAVPQLVIFDYVEIVPGARVYDCWDHFDPRWTLRAYVTWFALAVYVIPLVVLATIYVRICAVVWRSAGKKQGTAGLAPRKSDLRRSNPATSTFNGVEAAGGEGGGGGGGDGSTPNSDQDSTPRTQTQQNSNVGLTKAKAKTVKLTLTVVVSYICCWGPFFVSQMWSAWDPKAPFEGNDNYNMINQL